MDALQERGRRVWRQLEALPLPCVTPVVQVLAGLLLRAKKGCALPAQDTTRVLPTTGAAQLLGTRTCFAPIAQLTAPAQGSLTWSAAWREQHSWRTKVVLGAFVH